MREVLDGTLSETQGGVSDGMKDCRQRWMHFLTMVAAAQAIACLAASVPWFIALFGVELGNAQSHQCAYHKKDGPLRHKVWQYIGIALWCVGTFLTISGGDQPRPVFERMINMVALLLAALGHSIASHSWHKFQHRSRSVSVEQEQQHKTVFFGGLVFGCIFIVTGIWATWLWIWFG